MVDYDVTLAYVANAQIAAADVKSLCGSLITTPVPGSSRRHSATSSARATIGGGICRIGALGQLPSSSCSLRSQSTARRVALTLP